jgi:hypothetical protein
MHEDSVWVYVSGRWSIYGPFEYLAAVAAWADAGLPVLVVPVAAAGRVGTVQVGDIRPASNTSRRRLTFPVSYFDDCPVELQVAITEFWPAPEWVNAAAVAKLESGWNAFALLDTTSPSAPCGTVIRQRNGHEIVAQRRVGYFLVDTCPYPEWEWQRLYNARHNAVIAHTLWEKAGRSWRPWPRSAGTLGIL